MRKAVRLRPGGLNSVQDHKFENPTAAYVGYTLSYGLSMRIVVLFNEMSSGSGRRQASDGFE